MELMCKTSKIAIIAFLALLRCSLGNPAGFGYFTTSDAYAQAVMVDTPLAWWRLRDAAPAGAGSVVDSKGTNYGTPNGTITWAQAGPIAADYATKSAAMNGTTGYVTCGASVATTLMNSAAWSVELWYYAGATNGGTLFGAASDATHRVRIEHFGNTLYTTSNVGGNKSSTTSGKLVSTWHHVILTSSGDLYSDGVAQTGVTSSANVSTNQLTIGAKNDGTAFFNGRIAEVAVYQSVLSSTRALAHFNAGITAPLGAGRNFYWTMEAMTPDTFPRGGDDTPSFDLSAALTSAQAYAGTQSLAVAGSTFRSATFDNATSVNRWATQAEGTIRGRFRYNGLSGTPMLGQITGKDRSSTNDTNDGVKMVFTAAGGTMTYSYAGGASTTVLSVTSATVADTWYDYEYKWRTSAAPYLSITINGVTATSNSTFGSTNCTAWHHLLIGNDTSANPTGLWLDNVEVYGSWQP